MKNPKVTDFGYMLLHEPGNKLFYVSYKNPNLGGYNCMVFGQRGGKGTRHLIYDGSSESFQTATETVAVAEFDIAEIQAQPKKFDIRD